MFWCEIGSGFGEPGRTSPPNPRFLGVQPRPQPHGVTDTFGGGGGWGGGLAVCVFDILVVPGLP